MLKGFVVIVIYFRWAYRRQAKSVEFTGTVERKSDVEYRLKQGVTQRCRLSWPTNSAFIYEPQCGGMGFTGSQPMSTAVHTEPK